MKSFKDPVINHSGFGWRYIFFLYTCSCHNVKWNLIFWSQNTQIFTWNFSESLAPDLIGTPKLAHWSRDWEWKDLYCHLNSYVFCPDVFQVSNSSGKCRIKSWKFCQRTLCVLDFEKENHVEFGFCPATLGRWLSKRSLEPIWSWGELPSNPLTEHDLELP